MLIPETKAEPNYPLMAKKAKVSGEVILECIIDEEGHVSVHRRLKEVAMVQEAAEEAVQKWRYKPALYEGRPQAVFLVVRLKFNLSS